MKRLASMLGQVFVCVALAAGAILVGVGLGALYLWVEGYL